MTKLSNEEKSNNSNVLLPAVKLCVGQTIWIVPSHYYRSDNKEPKEVVISKVGRKYFELEGYNRSKFNIETLQEENETNYKSQCYLTLQEILDEREIEKLTSQLKNIFGTYGKLDLTLEQLRKITDIVGGKI